MVYISLLNQIGNSLKPRKWAGQIGQPNPIEYALEAFAPSIPLAERRAIYALRNSFMHDFSLVNLDEQRKRPHYIHRFVVCVGIHFLVALPANPWNGMDPARQDNVTTISLEKLADEVESIHEELVTLNEAGELTIIGGIDMQNRYLMRVG